MAKIKGELVYVGVKMLIRLLSRTKMLSSLEHRNKKVNDIHEGKLFSAKFEYEGAKMRQYDVTFQPQ